MRYALSHKCSGGSVHRCIQAGQNRTGHHPLLLWPQLVGILGAVVHDDHPEGGVPGPQLPQPLAHDSGRAHNDAGLEHAATVQACQEGSQLYGLAQPHLIADDASCPLSVQLPQPLDAWGSCCLCKFSNRLKACAFMKGFVHLGLLSFSKIQNLRQLRNQDKGQTQCMAFNNSGLHSIWQHCSLLAQRPMACTALTSHHNIGAGEEMRCSMMDSSHYQGNRLFR